MPRNPPISWNALWDPRYKGHVALYNDGAQAIPQTAILLGQDPNNITDLDAVMAKLKELKPNLLKFWSSGAELTSLFATGEVWIADFWRGRVNNLKKDGQPVAYTPTQRRQHRLGGYHRDPQGRQKSPGGGSISGFCPEQGGPHPVRDPGHHLRALFQPG